MCWIETPSSSGQQDCWLRPFQCGLPGMNLHAPLPGGREEPKAGGLSSLCEPHPHCCRELWILNHVCSHPRKGHYNLEEAISLGQWVYYETGKACDFQYPKVKSAGKKARGTSQLIEPQMKSNKACLPGSCCPSRRHKCFLGTL